MRRLNRIGRIRMVGPSQHGRIRMVWTLDDFGRVRMGPSPKGIAGSPWPSPNGIAESPWPSPTRLLDHFGRVRMGPSPKGIAGLLWPSPNGLAESEWPNPMPWLLPSEISHIIRSLVRQMPRHMPSVAKQLAWCAQMPRAPRLSSSRLSYPFCKLTGSFFKFLIRTKNGVYSCPSLLISEKQK